MVSQDKSDQKLFIVRIDGQISDFGPIAHFDWHPNEFKLSQVDILTFEIGPMRANLRSVWHVQADSDLLPSGVPKLLECQGLC